MTVCYRSPDLRTFGPHRECDNRYKDILFCQEESYWTQYHNYLLVRELLRTDPVDLPSTVAPSLRLDRKYWIEFVDGCRDALIVVSEEEKVSTLQPFLDIY